jgi:molybdopterin/thiamine biosynthesis adenylyltransferase
MDLVSASNSRYRTRFQGAPWYKNEKESISLVGAGGIGSWAAFFISSIGHHLEIYDDDFVDDTNLGGQLYAVSDIGNSKVTAVREMCYKFRDNANIEEKSRYRGQSTYNIVIGAVDNMKARKSIAESFYSNIGFPYDDDDTPTHAILIDGRMTAESFQVFAINSRKRFMQYREEWLFSDDEAPDGLCSYKATSHVGAHIGAVITEVLNNHLANYYSGSNDRAVPFMTQVDTPFMLCRDTY